MSISTQTEFDSPTVDTSERSAAGAAERTREQVRAVIRENAVLSPPYLVMNGLAAVVASYGLLQNSAAVVIGAMIIAMLLGPITGMALALVEGDNPLLARSLLAEAVGALLVLSIGLIMGQMHGSIPIGDEITSRTAPNILDLAIALAAGAAGAYASISPKISASLVGVAIATALVPPLCSAAICFSRGLYAAGGGAFLLFLANLVAIQCVTSIVLALHGYASHEHLRGRAFVKRFGPSIVLLGMIAVFLAYSFHRALERDAFRKTVERALRAEIEASGAARLADLSIGPERAKGRVRVTAVVRAPWIVVPESCGRLEQAVRRATGRENIKLHIRTILTRECDAQKFLWEDEPEAPEPLSLQPSDHPVDGVTAQ